MKNYEFLNKLRDALSTAPSNGNIRKRIVQNMLKQLRNGWVEGKPTPEHQLGDTFAELEQAFQPNLPPVDREKFLGWLVPMEDHVFRVLWDELEMCQTHDDRLKGLARWRELDGLGGRVDQRLCSKVEGLHMMWDKLASEGFSPTFRNDLRTLQDRIGEKGMDELARMIRAADGWDIRSVLWAAVTLNCPDLPMQPKKMVIDTLIKFAQKDSSAVIQIIGQVVDLVHADPAEVKTVRGNAPNYVAVGAYTYRAYQVYDAEACSSWKEAKALIESWLEDGEIKPLAAKNLRQHLRKEKWPKKSKKRSKKKAKLKAANTKKKGGKKK